MCVCLLHSFALLPFRSSALFCLVDVIVIVDIRRLLQILFLTHIIIYNKHVPLLYLKYLLFVFSLARSHAFTV